MDFADKAKILIVDDIDTNLFILQEILSDTYEIEFAHDGMEAVTKLLYAVEKPNLVLLDIMMPIMDGFEVLEFIKSNAALKKIPVIFITAADDERKALSAGAVDYISKPFAPEIVKLRVNNQVELNLYREKLEELVCKKSNELVVTKENFLDTMANLIEYRSLESGEHVYRTRALSNILVTALIKRGVYAEMLIDPDYSLFIRAVPLHDIGKIAIPDNILLKPGKLTNEEFKMIETHTTVGAQAIQSLMVDEEDRYLKHCYDICRSHHEHWDGKGYPDNLKETDIPLSARIVAVADVYDALVSERCYKRPIPHKEAIHILNQSSGSHFDPEIISALLEAEKQFESVYKP